MNVKESYQEGSRDLQEDKKSTNKKHNEKIGIRKKRK